MHLLSPCNEKVVSFISRTWSLSPVLSVGSGFSRFSWILPQSKDMDRSSSTLVLHLSTWQTTGKLVLQGEEPAFTPKHVENGSWTAATVNAAAIEYKYEIWKNVQWLSLSKESVQQIFSITAHYKQLIWGIIIYLLICFKMLLNPLLKCCTCR